MEILKTGSSDNKLIYSSKRLTDESLDEIQGIQQPTSDIQGGSANVGTKRKIVEGTEESGELDFTEKPPLITSNQMMKKNKEMEEKKLPSDEQRCVRTSGKSRCKSFKMGHGCDENSVPKSSLCEKHYKDLELERKKLPPDELRCGITGFGGWRCKNFRMNHDDDSVPKTRHCEKHYNYYNKRLRKKKTSGDGDDDTSDIQGVGTKNKKMLPPDEERCSLASGTRGWRCMNYRMGHGAADDDNNVPKSKYCEKHYNSKAMYNNKKKKTSGDHGEETNKVTEEDHDTCGSANIGTKKKENELPPDEHRCGRTKGKWRCKNFRMSYGAAAADDDTFPKIKVCEKHYNDDKNRKKKKTSGDGEGAGSGPVSEKLLPPDEERCCHTDGKGWRCKKFRMGHGADADADADDDHSVPKTKYCGKHHNHFAEMNLLRKKSSGNGDTSVIGAKRKHVERTKTVVETRASKRRMNVMEGDQFVAETSNQPATHDNCDYKLGSFCPADTIVEGGSDNNGRKMKHAERMSRELESLSGTREAAAELESLKHHKSKSMELQKKKAECTELVKKAKNKKTRKTTSTDENEQTLADATERWKKLLLCCLQSKVNEKSTRGCGESRISNSESLVFRSGKESSISRCVELRNAERVVSEVPGLENDITQSCENPTDDSNRGILNAETSSGGRKDSHVHECKTKEKVLNVSDAGANKHNESEYEFPKYAAMNIFSAALHLSSEGQNVEEGEGWGSSKRSSQHHLESLNEYEDFDIPVDPKNSLGDPMEMLAMKNWKRNNDEMKWKSEPDMLSSFEEDPEICLKAICALYRQEISEDPISPKGLLFDDDTVRCTTLAKFLMDEDCKGDLKKSMKELETLDSKAVDDCKMLARRYSLHLFYIYKDKKDPFFRPATTASQGEQTSK